MDKENHFSRVVSAKLRYYVYRLIDPRSGTTFYVGRGHGNRVFSHAAGDEKPKTTEEAKSLKFDTIRDIKANGFEVVHVIHRHDMSAEVAREVEAALIDAYPGLANIQPGYDRHRGVMHADQAIRTYEPEEVIFKHKVILFKIDKSLKNDPMISIGDAVRYAWVISKEKAAKSEYVCAVLNGEVVGVFVAKDWRPATRRNFPGFPLLKGKRFGFTTRPAPKAVKDLYLHKRVPPQKLGARRPFRYEPKSLWEHDPENSN